MNRREVCKLKTVFQSAFALALADALDCVIDGYCFHWSYGNGCIIIRELHGGHDSKIVVSVFVPADSPLVLVAHYSFSNLFGCIKPQSHREFDLADPVNTPHSIALVIRDMINSTLPYELAGKS